MKIAFSIYLHEIGLQTNTCFMKFGEEVAEK